MFEHIAHLSFVTPGPVPAVPVDAIERQAVDAERRLAGFTRDGLCPGRYLYFYDAAAPVRKIEKDELKAYETHVGGATRNTYKIMDGLWVLMCWGRIDGHGVMSVRLLNINGVMRLMVAMPLDYDYFLLLVGLDGKYPGLVYPDALDIFSRMGPTKGLDVDFGMVRYIEGLCRKYGDDYHAALTAFMHLYYGFVAEDLKENTYVGRLIKMWATARIFVGREPVSDVIKTSSMPWRYIRDESWSKYGLVCPHVNYGDSPFRDDIAAATGWRLSSTGIFVPVACA